MNGGGSFYRTIERQRTQSMISNRSMNGSLKHCSCKVRDSDTVSCKLIGVTTPRLALGRDILQASLTIIPAAAQVDLRGSQFTRQTPTMLNHYGEIASVLPTRHSKSLDQLEQEHSIVTPRSETFYGRENGELLYKALQVLESRTPQDLGLPIKKKLVPPVPREDLLKNINEFKQKYKNPGAQTTSIIVNHNDINLNHCITNGNETKCTLTLDRFPSKRTEMNGLTRYDSERQNGDLHFNSLPKNSTIGNTAPTRQKRYSKHCSTGKEQSGSFSTLPRSKSSQNLNGIQRPQHSFRYSRVRITDYKRSIRRKSRSKRSLASQQEYSSSSSDSEAGVYEKCKMPRLRNQKKILASMSVPHQLEHLNGDGQDKVKSDSLPSSSPISSGASSPRLVKSESLKITGEKLRLKKSSHFDQSKSMKDKQFTNSAIKKRIYGNGTKMNEKSKSEFDLPNANDNVATIEELRLVPPEGFRDAIFTPLPPEEFRDSDEKVERAKLKNGAPEKPEVSKKERPPRRKPAPVIPNNKSPPTQLEPRFEPEDQLPQIRLIQAIDNPLYHMCDIITPLNTKSATKIIKSQSSNELFGMAKTSSSTSHISLNNCCSRMSSPKSIHRLEAAKNPLYNDQPPLLEFEKCREEFRKQVNYNGSIYSDFTKLASELPYFYISDELRAFSPNGLHLIVCVHGKIP